MQDKEDGLWVPVADKGGEITMHFLKIAFPALMVLGAFGSLLVNVIDGGDGAVSLQWIGACLLYTALLLRNMG